jgi:hypothetical protein
MMIFHFSLLDHWLHHGTFFPYASGILASSSILSVLASSNHLPYDFLLASTHYARNLLLLG